MQSMSLSVAYERSSWPVSIWGGPQGSGRSHLRGFHGRRYGRAVLVAWRYPPVHRPLSRDPCGRATAPSMTSSFRTPSPGKRGSDTVPDCSTCRPRAGLPGTAARDSGAGRRPARSSGQGQGPGEVRRGRAGSSGSRSRMALPGGCRPAPSHDQSLARMPSISYGTGAWRWILPSRWVTLRGSTRRRKSPGPRTTRRTPRRPSDAGPRHPNLRQLDRQEAKHPGLEWLSERTLEQMAAQ